MKTRDSLVQTASRPISAHAANFREAYNRLCSAVMDADTTLMAIDFMIEDVYDTDPQGGIEEDLAERMPSCRRTP